MSVIKNISASPKEDKNSESPRSLEGEMDSISAESLTGKLKVRFMDIEEGNRWEIGVKEAIKSIERKTDGVRKRDPTNEILATLDSVSTSLWLFKQKRKLTEDEQKIMDEIKNSPFVYYQLHDTEYSLLQNLGETKFIQHLKDSKKIPGTFISPYELNSDTNFWSKRNLDHLGTCVTLSKDQVTGIVGKGHIPWHSVVEDPNSAVYQLCVDTGKTPLDSQSFDRKATLLAECLMDYGIIKGPNDFFTLTIEGFNLECSDYIKYDIAYRIVGLRPIELSEKNEYIKQYQENHNKYVSDWDQFFSLCRENPLGKGDTGYPGGKEQMIKDHNDIAQFLRKKRKDDIDRFFIETLGGNKDNIPQILTLSTGDYTNSTGYDGVDKSLYNTDNNASSKHFQYNSSNPHENDVSIKLSDQKKESEVMILFTGLESSIRPISFTISFQTYTNETIIIEGTYGQIKAGLSNKTIDVKQAYNSNTHEPYKLKNIYTGVKDQPYLSLKFPPNTVKNGNINIHVKNTSNDEISMNIIAPKVDMTSEQPETPFANYINLSTETLFDSGEYKSFRILKPKDTQEKLVSGEEGLEEFKNRIKTFNALADNPNYKQTHAIPLNVCVSDKPYQDNNGQQMHKEIETIQYYINKQRSKLDDVKDALFNQGKNSVENQKDFKNVFSEDTEYGGVKQIEYQKQLCLARLMTFLINCGDISPNLDVQVNMYVNTNENKDKYAKMSGHFISLQQ